MQEQEYGAVLQMAKSGPHSSRWLAVLDLDEFAFGVGSQTIAQVLWSHDSDVGMLCMPWMMFGSSGLVNQPESITRGFIKRWPLTRSKMHTKCIARTDSAIKLSAHNHFLRTTCHREMSRCADGSMFTGWECPATLADIASSPIRLHHYQTQSKNRFLELKGGRRKLAKSKGAEFASTLTAGDARIFESVDSMAIERDGTLAFKRKRKRHTSQHNSHSEIKPP